ncbi:hypothetical protein BH23BAC1_BH23BAC1_36100 [soil metagenome]
MAKLFYFLILYLFLFPPAFAQDPVTDKAHQFHSWFYYVGDHKISDKWGIHPEIQFRRTGFGRQPQQFLLRSAVNYHPSDKFMVSAGYVYSREYPYGVYPRDFELPEHRIYQQLEFEHKLGKYDLIHRTRTEQRFVADIEGVPDPDSEGNLRPVHQGWPLQHRARYAISINYPLQGVDIDNNEFYLFASNEVFLSFGRNVSNEFDQNRAQIGIGYQVGSFGRVEIGYLYQWISDTDELSVENNHTLTVSWISRFDLKNL